MEIIVQDGISYKIEGGIIKGWFGQSPFTKPFYNGTVIVEGWTQADEDAKVIADEKLNVAELLAQFELDGNAFYIGIRTLVKYSFDQGTITGTQFKNIKVTLEPAIRPLRLGDWDIAQDNINAISRPTGNLGPLYDFVKNGIDTYLV